MACIEASCPNCNNIVFGNNGHLLAVCQKCGSFMFLQHDELGSFNLPDSVKKAEFDKYLKMEKNKYKGGK